MATIIGTISEFDEATDTWQAYIERMEQFFVANNIEQEEKKKAIMISSVGAKTYKLMCSLMAPKKPSECQLQTIIDTVKNHHNPRPSTIVQRFKFNSKSRQEGESVRTFVAELKKLSEFCEYGDNLEEMLRDRLVCGINDRRMQQKLLSEKDLTYQKAVEIAQGMEAAMEGASDIGVSYAKEELKFTRSSTNMRWTNALPKGNTSKKTGDVKMECPRCGGPHHKDKCRFKDATCYRCSKKGHIASQCRSSAQNYRRGTRPVKFLGDNEDNGNDDERVDDENYALYSIRDKKRAFEVELKVDQKDLR